MKTLRIPYGLNQTGELISAEHALKNTNYSCPFCRVQLVLRAGEVKIKHFAHQPSSKCSLESVLHITAKKLIQSVIIKNATDNQRITLESSCSGCGENLLINLPIGTFSNAELETKIGKYRSDVVGFRDNSIALAIEICNTHAVDQIKAEELEAHWIELKAEDVIINPTKWFPTQSNLKDTYCVSCKKYINHVLEIANKYDIDRSLYSLTLTSPQQTYIAGIETCFKCKQEIPVFWWPGVPFCQFKPPSPMPKTIKYRKSKQFGDSYWLNTCANCNMTQGDNYLHLSNRSLFKGRPILFHIHYP